MVSGENSGRDTQYTLNVHVKPIAGRHLSEMLISATVFTMSNRRGQVIPVEAMLKTDEDNLIAFVDSSVVGPGQHLIKLLMDVPSKYYPNGRRVETRTKYTGVTIDPW